MPIYSDREFDCVLQKHADQLVVICASSSDCVPCRAFEPSYEVGMLSCAFDLLTCLILQLLLGLIADCPLSSCYPSRSTPVRLWVVMQKFASVYNKVVFLHFYAESNEMTKYLDQVKLKVERHPHFAMFRNGKTACCACYSGLSHC